MPPTTVTIYVAHRDFEEELWSEIAGAKTRSCGLIFSNAPAQPSVWAQDVWRDVRVLTFAELVKNKDDILPHAKVWHFYPGSPKKFYAKLDAVFSFAAEPRLEFGKRMPAKNFGVVATDGKRVCVATQTAGLVPFGKMEFVENKTAPPNRAYLNLWEILTRLQKFPQKGETALDLGASPGGWTWVLAGLGAKVEAVDKSALDPKIAKLPGVRFLQGSAFSIQPLHHEPVDWIFSDVICYPQRLLTFVTRWVASGKVKNMVCTIKLQGTIDPAVLQAFQSLAGAQVLHLYHNKHELTWVWSR